jgi:rubredoxin-NAD+ reductase
LQVTLANGSRIDSDVVLSAVGLRPDLRLAQAAQLNTARGIVVDVHGKTSASDVYALGDCAEYTAEGRTCTLPYVAPLMAAARAIARTFAGQPTAIDLKPAAVLVKTPSFPLALVPPPMGTVGAWRETRSGAHLVCRYVDDSGMMAGFGVAPQEAAIRQSLMAELGSKVLEAAA